MFLAPQICLIKESRVSDLDRMDPQKYELLDPDPDVKISL